MTLSFCSPVRNKAFRLPLALVSVSCLVLLAGCQPSAKNDGVDAAPVPKASAAATASAAANATATAAANDSPPPPAFTGALTVERVVSAKGVVNGMQPYAKAFGELVAILGAPTKTVSGNHAIAGKKQDRYQWAAMSGTTCASYFAVQNPDVLGGPGKLSEDSGGGKFEMPKKVKSSGEGRSEISQNWRTYTECVAILGQKPGFPADDPKGAGPGATITKADIDKGIELAPGKWIGKTVTFKGSYEGISGGAAMTLKDSRGDLLSCLVPTGTKPPEQKSASAKITVKGKVADPRELREMNGDLEDCVLVP